MNIFEDLIEELKEENLLEETVIEFHSEKPATFGHPGDQSSAVRSRAGSSAGKEGFQLSVPLPSNKESGNLRPELSANQVLYQQEEFFPHEEEAPLMPEDMDALIESLDPDAVKLYPKVEKTKMFGSEREYFRKRAMDEVTGLQMVDHVLSGVEREQMKLVPKPYDDLPVKLALHDFLQIAHETSSTEHARSEFRLMQETENWCSALSHRDKHISIAYLRRYCETTRPALSSQALIALARFYRNSPYSEPVRSKFELVATRLFSREDDLGFRELLLSRDEMIQQIKELYADWSSIQLYSSDEEDSEILISVLKFKDFINEADKTKSFEELISNDFFNRLRMFKQNCQENFFSPLVTVSAIEANVRIGNRYLELLNKEKEKFNAATLEEKYGFLHDQAISDATGKTFQLGELLHERGENLNKEAAQIVEVTVKDQKRSRAKTPQKPSSKIFVVNKWLLGATILTIVVCIGLFLWAESDSRGVKMSPNVKKVNLENSEFKDFVNTARIDNQTLYGVSTGAWESLNRDRKEEMLKKLLSVGGDKNYHQVHLINSAGKSVGFASAEKVEIYNQ